VGCIFECISVKFLSPKIFTYSLLFQSFLVYASTPSEKREWMLHIERCIQDLLKEGRLPPSDYAALWVPDKEAVKCMV